MELWRKVYRILLRVRYFVHKNLWENHGPSWAIFLCVLDVQYIFTYLQCKWRTRERLNDYFFSNHCRPFSSVVVTSKAYGSSLSVLWWNCSPVINIVFNVVHFVTFAVDCINVKCYLRYCSMWNEQMLIKTHFASWNGWGNLWHRWGKCSKGMFVGAKSIHWVPANSWQHIETLNILFTSALKCIIGLGTVLATGVNRSDSCFWRDLEAVIAAWDYALSARKRQQRWVV